MSGEPPPEAETGRPASAHSLHAMQDPPVRSLDLFAGAELCPLIDHPAWGAQDETPGFLDRFAAAAYADAQGPESVSEFNSSSNGDGESMAVRRHSHTMFSDPSTREPPSLDSRSTVRSESSVQSWEAESAVAAGVIDEDGNLVEGASLAVQPPSGLRCLFSFLSCPKVFLDPVAWHDHSKSHYRGATPPRAVRCPYEGCKWSTEHRDGEVVWASAWSHLVCEHDLPGTVADPWKRPDASLIQYLYGIRAINGAQYQELREHGQLGLDAGAYYTTEGREKHERRNRRAHMATRR